MAIGPVFPTMLLLLGLFGGLEIGPLVMRRDTLGSRLTGVAVGAAVIVTIAASWWSGMVMGGARLSLGPAVVWFCVFGAGVLAAWLMEQRAETAPALTVLAACGGCALAAIVVVALMQSAEREWMYATLIPFHPLYAALHGAVVGLAIGLREVLASPLGARGERLEHRSSS